MARIRAPSGVTTTFSSIPIGPKTGSSVNVMPAWINPRDARHTRVVRPEQQAAVVRARPDLVTGGVEILVAGLLDERPCRLVDLHPGQPRPYRVGRELDRIADRVERTLELPAARLRPACGCTRSASGRTRTPRDYAKVDRKPSPGSSLICVGGV